MKKFFTILSIVSVATIANAQVVINEIYGGGGNSGATWKNDFVELINKGTTAVTVTGATLQYTSSAGSFTAYHTIPDFTLAAGQTYLIQEAVGTGGTTNLPTPDFIAPVPTGSTGTVPGFAMSATNGKIALVSNSTLISTPTDSNVLDFVGFGNASQYEGAAAAPVMTNTTSDFRTNGIDTNVNSVDFTNGTPSPKNSLGQTSLAVSDINFLQSNFVRNTLVNNEINFGSRTDVKVYNMNGQVVKSSNVSENNPLEVAFLPKGAYIVTGKVDGKAVSQKIIKE